MADDPVPSPVARALAQSMRSFDASLTDEQIETIAQRIERARAYGASLSPKKKRLRNADEPLTAVHPAENA